MTKPDTNEKLETANFIITETWSVECPSCYHEQGADCDWKRPMQPVKAKCENCCESFILTFERDE